MNDADVSPQATRERDGHLTTSWQSRLKSWRETGQLSVLSPILVLILMIVVMSIGDPKFLSLQNFINILEQIATLLIMGLGQTFVILLGSIDLSVAAVASLTSIVAAMLVPQLGYGAFVVATLVGVGAGLLTGLVHTKTRIPSFIASLGALRRRPTGWRVQSGGNGCSN